MVLRWPLATKAAALLSMAPILGGKIPRPLEGASTVLDFARGAAFLDRPFTSVTRGVVPPLRNRACPRSVVIVEQRIVVLGALLSCHAAAAMASRPKSSGGYKRSVASRARYIYIYVYVRAPGPLHYKPSARGLALERHAKLGRRSPIVIFYSLFCDCGAQSRTKDFYRSPGRCERALKKPWRAPKPFQDAYPADNAQPSRSAPAAR